MIYEIPNEPTYAKCKIEDLCVYLGYPPNNDCGRSLYNFRTTVVNFRKAFTEKWGIPLGTFPIDASSPIVNRCARDFLESHKELFPEDPVALGHGWPTYPDEKKKIISGLAKLMCVQELSWRKNENQKAARETAVDYYQDDERAYNGTSVKKGQGHCDSDAAQYESENYDEARRAIARNIQVHLEYAYPLNLPPQTSIPDSLFSDELDLDNIDPFPMRYIHEHCLYHCRRANEPEFTKFAKCIYRHYHMACDENGIEQMSRMLKRFVRRIVKNWGDFEEGGYGFLVELGNKVIRKTADFEAAWKARRERWIQLVHQGSTDGLLEIQHASKSMTFRTPGTKSPKSQKRVCECSTIDSLPRQDTSTSKRQRMGDSQSDHLEGSTICVESADFEETGSSYSAEATPRRPKKKPTPNINQPVDTPENTANTVLSILGNLRQVSEGYATPTRLTAETPSQNAPPKSNNASKIVAQIDKSPRTKPISTTIATTAQVSVPMKGKDPQADRDLERSWQTSPSKSSASNVSETPKAPAGPPRVQVDTSRATSNPAPASSSTRPTSNKASSSNQMSSNLPVLEGLVKPPANSPSAPPQKPITAPAFSTDEAHTPPSTEKSQISTIQPTVSKPTRASLHSLAGHQDSATGKAKTALVVKLPVKLRDSLNQLSTTSFANECGDARWDEVKSRFASAAKPSITTAQDHSPPTSLDSSADTPQTAESRAPETEDPTSVLNEEKLEAPASRPIHTASQGKSKTSEDEHNRTSLPSPIRRSGSIDTSVSKSDQKLLSTDFIGQMNATLAAPGQLPSNKFDNAINDFCDPKKSPQAKLIKRSSSVLHDSPRKPTLQFAFQATDGFPDDSPSRLVSLKKVSNLSLTEFFKLIELRSGQCQDAFDCVTLRYQWGDGVAHVINRLAGDESWKATTSKMEKIFFNARMEFRKRTEFLVWVSCGDRTNLMEDSEEEVDEMEE